MKRLTLMAALLMLASLVYAGGLLTNTNQSAQFIRMMSRNASTDIDAVYFNPAGLIKLDDGWHFAAYSQTILQEKPVVSRFPLLNDSVYDGKVNVPVFPTAFAVYKMDKWAFSLGIGPNAGGGSAIYDNGLPSFEIPISKIPSMINRSGIPTTNYDVDMYFKGTSVFWGIQLGAAYEISDLFLASLGVRVLPSTNKYVGYIRNIQINPTLPQLGLTGEMIPATSFFSVADPEKVSLVSDKEVETTQSGIGFTPIVGLNITPIENLNIGVKYEMKTTLTLENKPAEGDNYSEELFGEGVQNDIPAILAVGMGYNTEFIEAQLSYNMYFNKNVDWGPNIRNMSMQREIDKNGMEVALGLQFNVLENFAFSVGGMYGDQGIADSYQSDFSFSNPSVTAGAGVEWKLTEALTLDAGFSNTFYQNQTVTFTDPDVPNGYQEIYSKKTMNFAVGLSYTLFR